MYMRGKVWNETVIKRWDMIKEQGGKKWHG